MIKCALSLLIIATCIVGIFADDYEKRRKLDSECAKKGAEITELNIKIANLQNKVVVYEEREKKSLETENNYNELNDKFIELNKKLGVYEEREKKTLEEGTKCTELNLKLDDLQDKIVVYEERERKSKEQENNCNELKDRHIKLYDKIYECEFRVLKSLQEDKRYNELNDKFIELNKKVAVYEYREKAFEEGNIKLKTKIANPQNDLGFYMEQERKSLEEGNMYNELNATLAKLPRILLNLQDRERKGIEEVNKSKQLNEQLGEVQEKLADCEERKKKDIEEINLNKYLNERDCEEREKKIKETNSKTESSLKASLKEYRKKLSNLESIILALHINNQNVKEDLEQLNNYLKYNNTCFKPRPSVDTTGSVEIEGMEAFSVYCVNNLNSGPGWMLIQKRIDNYALGFFSKDWSDFRDGFSYDNSDFFIGLEKLYRLTNAEPHELYIDMEDWDGNKKFAHYDNFRVGNESEQYPLKDLGNYTGNAGDALRDNNNMKFSTIDRDNDNSPDVDCVRKYYSAWWHNNCTKANLNGFQHGTNEYKKDGIWWLSHVALKTVRMLIRPKSKK